MSIAKQVDSIFPDVCPKCKGSGWCCWDQLDSNTGHDPGDSVVDDTKYTCDLCWGTGKTKKSSSE